MDKKLQTFQAFLFLIALSVISTIVSEIKDFSITRLESSAIYQKVIRGEVESPLLSSTSLEYSAYFLEGAQIAINVYLLLGIFYIFKVFSHAKEEEYFTTPVIELFKKAGGVFINYCIAVFSIEIIYLFVIQGSNRVVDILTSNNIPIIALCGLAFVVLSHIFEKGQQLKEENELTV